MNVAVILPKRPPKSPRRMQTSTAAAKAPSLWKGGYPTTIRYRTRAQSRTMICIVFQRRKLAKTRRIRESRFYLSLS